jgi:cytochrome c6
VGHAMTIRTRGRRAAPTPAVLAAVLLVLLAPGAAAQEGEADLETGRAVFTETASPPCAVCHALADAGASGAVGPDLDAMRPTADRVRAAVAGGIGIMPAFSGSLSEAQIAAVSEYVAAVAGGG